MSATQSTKIGKPAGRHQITDDDVIKVRNSEPFRVTWSSKGKYHTMFMGKDVNTGETVQHLVSGRERVTLYPGW